MADVAELTRMIEPEVEAEGLALVRAKIVGGTSDPTIQVMAKRPDTRRMTIDDCDGLPRPISERHEQLSDDYRLKSVHAEASFTYRRSPRSPDRPAAGSRSARSRPPGTRR